MGTILGVLRTSTDTLHGFRIVLATCSDGRSLVGPYRILLYDLFCLYIQVRLSHPKALLPD